MLYAYSLYAHSSVQPVRKNVYDDTTLSLFPPSLSRGCCLFPLYALTRLFFRYMLRGVHPKAVGLRASVARAEKSATSSKGGCVTSRLQRKPGNLFVEERVARLHSCIYLLSVPVGDPVFRGGV